MGWIDLELALTSLAAMLSPTTLTRPLELKREAHPWHDEIDQLADGFRTLQDGIRSHVENLDGLVKERTALVNQIRGLLAERGIVMAQGITRLRKQLPVIVEDEGNALTPLSREVMRELYAQLVTLDE